MSRSILSNVSSIHIERFPFPHFVLRNALDEDFYAELDANYPSLDQVAGSGRLKNNAAYYLSAQDTVDNTEIAPIWRQFFAYHTSKAFFDEVLDLWGEEIAWLYPDLASNFSKPIEDFTVGMRHAGKKRNALNKDTDVVLDCLFGNNSPVRSMTAVRGPHVDSSKKLFTALLYMRDPADDSSGGSYELYKIAKDKPYPLRVRKKVPPRYVSKVKEVPYEANTLLMWINSGLSLHGVTPRSITPHARRYINISAECYGGAREHYFSVIRDGLIEECYEPARQALDA